MSQLCAGALLVATTNLEDPHFHRTVVYIADHGPQGTLGFIVNRALELRLGEVWEACPVTWQERVACATGGPVEADKGLLLHGYPDIPGSASCGPGVWVGGELGELLHAEIPADGNPRGPRLFLGHSGWDSGQLAGEIAHGAWLIRPGHPRLVLSPRPAPDLWDTAYHAGQGPAQPSRN